MHTPFHLNSCLLCRIINCNRTPDIIMVGPVGQASGVMKKNSWQYARFRLIWLLYAVVYNMYSQLR